jgi:cbb3-type cytochrome oxidase subunit 3
VIEFFAIIAALAAIAGVFVGVVWLAERKAKAELREEQRDAEMQRLRDAIEADARGRERIARGELLQNDGYKRD